MNTKENKKPTIKDVARYAGVSTATVIRAIKNSGRIKEGTRERVLRSVELLGYRTNDVAKALKQGNEYNILAVYHTIPEYFTEDFKRGLAEAENNLRSRGLILHILRTKSLAPHCAVEALKTVDFSTIDAMLIDCGGSELDSCIQKITEMGIPVATFGSDSPSSGRTFYVGEDPYVSGQVAGEIAGKILGGKGSIAIFQGPTSVDALNSRTHGFMDIMCSQYPNVEILPCINHNDEDTLAVRESIRILNSEHRPSCIFCNSAGGTIALYRAFQYLDFPKENAPEVIGYDFNEEIYNMLQDGLCTVTIYQNPRLQAYNALTYMFEYITKGEIPPNALNYIPCDLVFKSNAHLFLKV